VSIHGDQDSGGRRARLKGLIDPPAQTRRIYQRKGFDDLEPNVLQVLIAAELEPGSIVGDLAARLALAQGTVSTALALLQQRGLLRATPDVDDARRQRQEVSTAGRALVDRFVAEVEDRRRAGRA
jgi:DNA-binding MarR family transcriptional regulator